MYLGCLFLLLRFYCLIFGFIVLHYSQRNKRSYSKYFIKALGGKLSRYTQLFLVISNSLIRFYLLYRYMFTDQRSEIGYNEGNFYSIPDELWKVSGFVVCIFVVIFILNSFNM